MTQAHVTYSRRTFLFFSAAAAGALVVRPDTSSAAESATRILALHSRWSDENFIGPYYERGRYLKDALSEINYLLRDRHNESVRDIDVRLLDLLHDFKQRAGYRASFEVVCGYRSKATNRALRKKSRLVAKESRHIVGQAVDLRFYDLPLEEAHRIALSMQAGGVGYYRRQNFLHLDVGPVRDW
jgi:uncharacterized protein YcbK (DUF882 family)